MRAAYVVVYLLYLATSFQAALPQRIPELNTYQATVGSPASGVSTSSIQDHPELDQVDDSRYQRTGQEGDLPFAESDWVDSVVITVFFPKDTDERVAVLVGDDLIDQLNAGDYNGTRRTIPPCQVPFPAQPTGCSIGDDWVFVTWSVDFEECTKEWRLLLSGRSEGDAVSIGEITVLGPKESCDEDTGLPVGIWAAIGGGAALLLMILLCGCWCWRKRKNRGDATARHSTWQAHEENGTGQQHESLIAAGSPNIQPSNESHQPRAQPTISPAVQSLPYHQEPTHVNEMSKVSSTPEAVKHSASVTTTAASVSQYDTNQGFSGNNTSGKRYPQAQTAPHQAQPQQVVHAAAHPDMGGSDDEELEGDPGPGPTMYDATDQEEPIDPQQNAMLKDIHLQQAAGITEMIQGVKENLMNQQTLKHKGGDDGGLEIFNKIGGGGFGEVFKGKYREKEVAVKIMKIKPGARQESLTELPYTEAAIAGICIHQNIVQTMYSDLLPVLDAQQQGEPGGSYWSRARTDGTPSQRGVSRGDSRVKEWQVRMVMEICDLGSVRDWVSPAAGQKYGALYSALPNKAGTKGCGSRTLCALLTSLDVANGMKLLHKYKILHSDLKPHNVLLCSSHTDPRGFIAKLSDFGLSMKMAAHDGQVPGIKYGTVQYLAPEVLNTHIMTKKADVYSFGIIMWEVWHSRLFAEFYNNEKRKRKQAGQSMEDYRPMVSSKCPRTYVHLMTQCLDRNPDKRPDFLGGQVNIVVELERLIYEEYAKMAASAAAQAQ